MSVKERVSTVCKFCWTTFEEMCDFGFKPIWLGVDYFFLGKTGVFQDTPFLLYLLLVYPRHV